jgi:ABC-2 type transport system permease protein
MLEQVSESQDVPKNSFLQSCKVIFSITFRQTIWSKKTIFMLITTFLPVLLAAYYRIFVGEAELAPQRVLSTIMPLFLQFLSVLVALLYASALIADEVDNETIIYLFTRPVRKYSIIIGKFLAYMLEVSIILVPAILLTYVIIAAGNGISSSSALGLSHFAKQLGVTFLALTTYGAIFSFFGTFSKHPVVIGLLFAFGWEKIVLMAPGFIRRFSVIHYLMSVFPSGRVMRGFRVRMPPGVIPDSSPSSSVVILLLITIVSIALTIFTIYRKEYRFE